MRLLAVLLAISALSACQPSPPADGPETANFQLPLNWTKSGQQAHGKRLSYALGCRGCHDANLQGRKFDDEPEGYGIMWASNLTRSVPTMSDVQLEKLLREGIHPTRKEMWAMPSHLFQHLSNADMAALIAHLRSLPAVGEKSPPPILGPKALAEIADGTGKPEAQMVSENLGVKPIDAGKQFAQGRYIASLTCAECHGMKLEGHQFPGEPSIPDLAVASAMSANEFDHFITTGELPDGRKIDDLMVGVAKRRFSKLTKDERLNLYNYLVARAKLPPTP